MTRALTQYLRDTDGKTPFCPGCGHGILMNAILRAVDRLMLNDRNTLFVSGIGCAAWIPSPHFNFDTLHTLHGRAIAFATGAKLAKPALTTIVVSGDGDLLSIGGNHFIHAARRNLDITVICANNFLFGMTGGQSAPTTPIGTTTINLPEGSEEPPIDGCRIALASGAQYVARYPVSNPISLSNAIENAIKTTGFTYIEAISPCPTQYGRRNNLADINALYDAVAKQCISQEAYETLSPDDKKQFIAVGEISQ